MTAIIDREKMARDNLPFITFYIKRYFPQYCNNHSPYGVDEDVFQEACIGYTRALNSFDPDKGEFTTYAGNWIHNHMLKLYRHENSMGRKCPGELLYLDAPFNNDDFEEATYADLLMSSIDEHGYEMVEVDMILEDGLKNLTNREKQIIFSRLNGLTQIQVARILGVTQNTIRRKEIKILKKIAEGAGVDCRCVETSWLRKPQTLANLKEKMRKSKKIVS